MTQSTTDSTPPALTLEAVSIRLAERAVLDAVSCSVLRGACVAIVGPGGAGKTTLLRAIAGLLPLASGAVRLDDEMGAIAYLPQDLGLWDAERANTHLAIATRAIRSRDERGAMIDQWLARVDLVPLARRRAAELSGGERRRLAIARTLAYAEARWCSEQRAPLVLLDEPFASLDVLARDAFTELLADFRARTGATLLATSHLREQVVAIADHAIVLEGGTITTEEPGCLPLSTLAGADGLTPFTHRFFELEPQTRRDSQSC